MHSKDGICKEFKFDCIFNQSNQNHVFQGAQIPYMLDQFIQGYDAAIMAYGLTGSGKTYTMSGELCTDNCQSHENDGIIQKGIQYIFNKIQSDTTISISYTQVYQEKVYDMLKGYEGLKSPLKLRSTNNGGFAAENLTVVKIFKAEEALNILLKGSKQIVIAENRLNIQSSRSHTIYTIILKKKDPREHIGKITSQIQFIDLAGSERFAYFKDANKTHVKEWYITNTA